MTGGNMKVHLLKDEVNFQCGKYKTIHLECTKNIKEVTCKSCLESYKYDRGLIPEYTMGGDFGKHGAIRKHQNQWTYKEEVGKLKKEIKTLREYVQGKCIQGLSDKPCDNKMCSGCALLKELSPYTI